MMRRKTAKEFIAQAQAVHGSRYDYSKVKYENGKCKVIIICHIHGDFRQTPSNHVNQKQGCPKCSGTDKNTTIEFIAKARAIHGGRYDYSEIQYKNNKTSVVITCKIHGDFKQRPNDHLSTRAGCPKCGNVGRLDTVEFIARARAVHGNHYDYSKAEYKSADKKVVIICRKHGEFRQEAYSHLKGIGCSECNLSKGESKIGNVLSSLGLSYIIQKKFPDCKNTNPLPFDFWLPSHNLLIEYQGEQHYKPCSFFGGNSGLRTRKKHDKIKADYAQENDIRLLIIPHWDFDRIEEILRTSF